MAEDAPPDILECATYEEIEASVGQLHAESDAVNVQLKDIYNTQLSPLSFSLQRLDILGASLSNPMQTARSLSQVVSDAAFVASRISQKVRQLDMEQSRVQEALDYVSKTQELKKCIIGIYDATQVRDWESVAQHINRASKLPPDLVRGKFAEVMVPTEENPDSPSIALQNATETFGALFLREFDAAAKEKDVEKITRFFKLFPLIGKEKEGLDIYAKFVCTIIASQSRQLMSTKTEGPLFFGMVISRLFENIATIVDQHSPIVERYYGRGKMQRVIERIQLEADTQGGIIIDTYFDERNINRRLSDMKSYAFSFLVQSFMPTGMGMGIGMGIRSPSPAMSSDQSNVNIQNIDTLLNECAVIIGRWSLYCKFLAIKWWTQEVSTDSVKNEISAKKTTSLKMPPIIPESKLYLKVNSKLAPAFESMATFFFRRSVEKAFQLDESPNLAKLPPEPSPTSPLITSAIDDVMYVLNAVLERSVSTGHSRLIRNVVSNVRRVLESDLVGMIQRKMRDETYPKAGTSGNQTYQPPPVDKVNGFLVLLNNLDVATEYIERIISTVVASCGDGDVVSVVPFGDEHNAVVSSLKSLSTSFDSRVKELLQDGTQVIFVQVIKPRIRPLISECFKDTVYISQGSGRDVDDEDLSQQQADLVRLRFSYGWDALMHPIRKILTERNYSRLLILTSESVSSILEKRIWAMSGRVNELGAIQLERDVAGIISHVSQGKWYSLREKFVRVAQIVMAIGLDEQEIEAGGIDWVLTEEERKRAASIRIDDM
ncbi:COG4 transport protein-domain-containing protein [Dipodascopsis uninucleata]